LLTQSTDHNIYDSLIRRGNRTEVTQPRKEDYLSNLNRLREKAIRSNISLDITNQSNDMIARASK